jgi:hypothetical protein
MVTLQQKILYVMEELVIWFQKNDLIINTEKTVAMFFHPNQFRFSNKPQVVVKNTELAFKP